MRKFIGWIRPSFEGVDGKASIRRIIAVIISLVYIYLSIYFVRHAGNDEYKFFTILTLALMFLLLWHIIYPQHIIEFMKAKKQEPKNNDMA